MKAKRTLVILVGITIIVTFLPTLKGQQEKSATEVLYEWFNGWISDLVKMRTTYHEKLGFITIPDTTNDDSTNPKDLKEMIDFLGQTKKLELWKIDTTLIITDYWYNKIDQMLLRKITKEQIEFIKSYLLDGKKIAIDFRQLNVTYFDDYLNVINFMYTTVVSGKKMDNNDGVKYNNLATNYIKSQELYNNRINYIFNYNVKRVEEFNAQFKNTSITKLLNQINMK